MHFLSLTMLLASLAGWSLAATTKCKCLASDPCFPSSATWATFAKNISNPLISNQRPPAAPCYSNTPEYSSSACDAAKAVDGTAAILAGKMNAMQYVNFEAIVNSSTIQDCPYDVQPGGVCYQGRVPSYAVNVSTVSDIRNTIRFASTHNLHLVVRNTGHELMGRSFGVGSLELFTHNLKSIQFSDEFVPAGAPKSTPGEPAVTMGAGVQWGEIYAAADQRNVFVPGGFSPLGTVGASGGWLLGGGHSVLSPFYGLGVDNALEFAVVLPNASYVTANKYQNPDLFWALRGGGGPSFGVVVSSTMRTHPNLPYTAVFFTAKGNTTASYSSLLETWMRHHNGIADAGWSGVWPFLDNSLYLTFFTQGTPPTRPTANKTMEAFFSAVRALPGVNMTLAMSKPYPSFQAWNQDNLIDSSKGFGFNFTANSPGPQRVTVSSWLMPRSLTEPQNAKMLAKIYTNLTVAVPYMVASGAVSQTDPDSVPVTPAWRTAVSDMTVIPSVGVNASVDIRAIQKLGYDQIQPFRELAPPPAGGQYLNEPDILESGWQEAYWGRHYPRLRAIKQAIDPQDLLIVRKGVNSEGWDDEITCKTA